MSYRDPRAEEFEARLKAVFDRIDRRLEQKYGRRFPLHPSRAAHGRTANPEDDGLFDVGAAFSAAGGGYVIEVRLATLAEVPQKVRQRIEREVVEWLERELPRAFPERRLVVERDGPRYRIAGDLSLNRAPGQQDGADPTAS